MDRQAYIKGLRLERLIGGRGAEDFFRSLARRTPTGSGDTAVAVRSGMERRLAELHAAMLGREPDHRVPVDIEAVSTNIADRIGRYTGEDWNRRQGTRSMADHVKHAIGEISADLQAVEAGLDPSAEDDDELE